MFSLMLYFVLRGKFISLWTRLEVKPPLSICHRMFESTFLQRGLRARCHLGEAPAFLPGLDKHTDHAALRRDECTHWLVSVCDAKTQERVEFGDSCKEEGRVSQE